MIRFGIIGAGGIATKFASDIKFVQNAMFVSTNEVGGTSYSSRIKDPKYQFAGKTGTSQVKRITERDRELDLKTIERANPSIVILEKGTIKQKVHYNDIDNLNL